MSKHYVSAKALCPYYHAESQSGYMIYCEGVQDGSVIHLAFASRTHTKEYKVKHCRNHYQQCDIYKMLARKEEEQRGGKNESRIN